MALAGVSVTTSYTADALSPNGTVSSLAEEREQYTVSDGAPPTPVLGCSTGAHKEIDHAIRRAGVSAKMRDLLHELRARAFETAGYQQHSLDPRIAAEPGIWAPFDLAEIARELDMRRSYVWRLREQAEHLGCWTYFPDAGGLGVGYIRWNLDFNSWTALDTEYQRSRYRRAGAGRKSEAKESNVIRSPVTDESNVIRTVVHGQGADESNVIRLPAQIESNVIRTPVETQIKSDTPGSRKAASQAAREGLLRIEREEETDAYASVASAVAAPSAAETPKTKRQYQRKLSDEQLAAHRAKAIYVNDVLAGIQTDFFKHSPMPSVKEMRSAAAWFYAARDGGPVPPDEVVAWYRTAKQTPFWSGKFLALWTVTKFYSGNDGNLDAFRRSVEAERAQAGRAYANGHQQHRGREGANTSGRSAEHGRSGWQPTHPDPNDDGEYATWPSVVRANERARAERENGGD